MGVPVSKIEPIEGRAPSWNDPTTAGRYNEYGIGSGFGIAEIRDE
jgi:hypothetical protein